MKKEHNEKWPFIPDHPHSSGSGKRNALLNLIRKQDYHDVIEKDLFVCKRFK